MKAGIWTKRNPYKSFLRDRKGLAPLEAESPKEALQSSRGDLPLTGLVILETLICLAILVIFLPMAHRFVLVGWKKYHQTLLKEKAVLIAQFELSRLEIETLRGNFASDPSLRPSPPFSIDRSVEDETGGLKKICVGVRWQTSDGPQKCVMEQWVWAKEKRQSDEG